MTHVFLFSLLLLSGVRPCQASSCIDASSIFSLDEKSVNKGPVDFCDQKIQELLDKVNAGKLIEIDSGQYYVTPLSKKYAYLEQEAREGLMYLNIPDYPAEKIPVLNARCNNALNHELVSTFLYGGMTLHKGLFAYAILINPDELGLLGTNRLKFALFHQVGHFRLLVDECCNKKQHPSYSDFINQNREELADIISLMILCRQYINEDRKSYVGQHGRVYPWLCFLSDIWQWTSKIERPEDCLQPKELIYYAKLIFSVMDSNRKEKISSNIFDNDLKGVLGHYVGVKKEKDHKKYINKEIASIIQSLEDIQSFEKPVKQIL